MIGHPPKADNRSATEGRFPSANPRGVFCPEGALSSSAGIHPGADGLREGLAETQGNQLRTIPENHCSYIL
jgi:hypothetical protein